MKKTNLNARLKNAKNRLKNAIFKTKKARKNAIEKELARIFKDWQINSIPQKIFNLQVYCEWKDRGGRGFAHVCKLLTKDFYIVEKKQVNYINRTWERFTYETAFKCCVFDYVKRELENV